MHPSKQCPKCGLVMRRFWDPEKQYTLYQCWPCSIVIKIDDKEDETFPTWAKRNETDDALASGAAQRVIDRWGYLTVSSEIPLEIGQIVPNIVFSETPLNAAPVPTENIIAVE